MRRVLRRFRWAGWFRKLGGRNFKDEDFAREKKISRTNFFRTAYFEYRRNLIALAGPVMNYVLAFLLFALVAGVWGDFSQPSLRIQPIVGDMIPGLPAAVAKLQPNDRILSINGAAVKSWDEMAKIIHEHPNEKLAVQIRERASTPGQDTQRSFRESSTPKRDAVAGIGLIGIMPKVDKVNPPGFKGSFRAVPAAMSRFGRCSRSNTSAASCGILKVLRNCRGVLASRRWSPKATREGILANVIYLIAIISTEAWAPTSFRFPVLDGGQYFALHH